MGDPRDTCVRWGVYFGLVCGIVYAFGGAIVDFLTVGLNGGTLMAFGALVGMPLIFGILGFMVGEGVALISGRRQGRSRRR